MPSPAVVAAYENALPNDEGIKRKKMFGSPAAFVNRQMFFGTFEDLIIARIGPNRVAALAGQPGITVFSPSPDKTWDDYVQMDQTVDPALFRELAAEALLWAADLPRYVKQRRK